MSDTPDPTNSVPMAELHKFVGEWSARHKLDSLEEASLLSHYLAGRLNVGVALNRVRALKPLHETPDDG